MKRIYVIFFIILLLAGCAANPDNPVNEESTATEESTAAEATEPTILLITGFDFYDLGWDEGARTYTGKAVPDMETAVGIASAIFDSMKKSPLTENLTVQGVFYDEENGIWTVSFADPIPADATTFTVGGSCAIAIKEINGEVLRIWFGE